MEKKSSRFLFWEKGELHRQSRLNPACVVKHLKGVMEQVILKKGCRVENVGE